MTFSDLGVSAPLVAVLAKHGIHDPFPVQTLVLPDAFAGTDILAESPTGSGKTLAFGLPLIHRTPSGSAGPTALVLVPTRELAGQIVDDLEPLARVRGLRIAAVYGGTPIPAQVKRARGANIIVATPGRLDDLLTRRFLSLGLVRVLVLDEADRMLDMGFRPQVDAILRSVPTNRQTMLFSATLASGVADLARSYTTNPSHVRNVAPAVAQSEPIEHAFVAVTSDDKLDRLVEQLNVERGLALVFVRTKHGADRLARKLVRQHGVTAAAMHGNMSQNARERTLAQFQSGHVQTLIATDVASRGLDVDDISHVINFDPPAGADEYVHRVGRTGRAGRGGTGITLVLPEQRHDVGLLADHLGHGEAFAGAGMGAATRPQPARPAANRRRRRRY
jgi:ATP-dependent RNA helicase RhlE